MIHKDITQESFSKGTSRGILKYLDLLHPFFFSKKWQKYSLTGFSSSGECPMAIFNSYVSSFPEGIDHFFGG
jgi:hypothetical protein